MLLWFTKHPTRSAHLPPRVLFCCSLLLQDCRPGGAADDALHRAGGQRGSTQVCQPACHLAGCTAATLAARTAQCSVQQSNAAPPCCSPAALLVGQVGHFSFPPPSLTPSACCCAFPCRSLCLVSFESHPDYGTMLAVGTAQGLKFYPKHYDSESHPPLRLSAALWQLVASSVSSYSAGEEA